MHVVGAFRLASQYILSLYYCIITGIIIPIVSEIIGPQKISKGGPKITNPLRNPIGKGKITSPVGGPI
jgi:hypothetical protein